MKEASLEWKRDSATSVCRTAGEKISGSNERRRAPSPKTPPTESVAKERQCVRRHRSEERREIRYREGIWTFLEVDLSSEAATRRPTGERDFHTPFLSEFDEMTSPEQDVRKMIAELRATR